MRSINQAGLDIIKKFEGLRLKAYKCPAGVWTIGYGHTNLANEPPKVTADLNITKQEAEEILKRDLERYEICLEYLLNHANKYINDNQFSALISFCFNVGLTAFKDSTMFRHIKNQNLAAAVDEFDKWSYGGGKRLPGLIKRRKWEKALFNKIISN